MRGPVTGTNVGVSVAGSDVNVGGSSVAGDLVSVGGCKEGSVEMTNSVLAGVHAAIIKDIKVIQIIKARMCFIILSFYYYLDNGYLIIQSFRSDSIGSFQKSKQNRLGNTNYV